MLNIFKKGKAESISLSDFIAAMDEFASLNARERGFKLVTKRKWAKNSVEGDYWILLSLEALKGTSYCYSLGIQPSYTPDVIESIKANRIIMHPKPFDKDAFSVLVAHGNIHWMSNGLECITLGEQRNTNQLRSMMTAQIQAIDKIVASNTSLITVVDPHTMQSIGVDFLFARALVLRAANKLDKAEAAYRDFDERLEMQSISTPASKKLFRDYYSNLSV